MTRSFEDARLEQLEQREWADWQRRCESIIPITRGASPKLQAPPDLPADVRAKISVALNCIEIACVADDGRRASRTFLQDLASAARNARNELRELL